MTRSIKIGFYIVLFSIFSLGMAATFRVTEAFQIPTEYYYRAVITSGEFSQEIQYYQSGDLIRQEVTTPGFPASITIFRPDLAVIWIYDEGGAEYSASPYDPRLIPEIFSFGLAESSTINRKILGKEKILGYTTEKIRITDPTMPEWEVYLWNAPKLGKLTLKKLERVTNNGRVVSELLVEVTQIKIKPIPQEKFELPEGMTLVEGLPSKIEDWEEEFFPDFHY